MNKDIVKAVIGLVAGAGASRVVNNVIKVTTPMGGSMLDKVLVGAGSMAISGVISGVAIDYTNKQVDFAYDAVARLKSGEKLETVIGEKGNTGP